jgi:diguanylate cyclase (GGDEF)-like protein
MDQQILLIDDSKPIHALVSSLLGDEPVTVHSAFDGEYGIALAASLKPDLILLDVEMPGMNGYETCRRLKANPDTASSTVVFLTSRSDTEDMVNGLNLGASDYVGKPFKLAELLSRVRAALRTSFLIRLLEETALVDSLTGLGNRGMFERRLAAEIGLRIRTGDPLSCILMDVDTFKNINDAHGHPFGDHVLTKIGETIMAICRVEDVACRYGGEEFIILAPRTSAEQAAQLAERMRSAIAAIPLYRQDEVVRVTCSFGVAEAVGTYDRMMVERADQALYESKKAGRDRVSVWPLNCISKAAAA